MRRLLVCVVPVLATVFLLSQEPGLTANPQAIYDPGPDVTPPAPLLQPSTPASTKKAEKREYKGQLELAVIVGADGKVEKATVEKSPEPNIDALAITEVSKLRFRPGTRNGEAVPTRVFATLLFYKQKSKLLILPIAARQISPLLLPDVGLVYRAGQRSTTPKAVETPDPEYTEPARKKHHQGTSVLWVVVDKEGNPRDIEVAYPTGYGLDEEAVKAVKHWKFKPALKDGQPVNTQVNVEINFRLY